MRNKLILFIVIIMVSLSGTAVISADSQNFSITPLNPETKQPQSSYYDLKVKPKEQKVLPVRIFNNSKEEVKVKLEVNNGSTNNNGVTSYLNTGNRDKSLKTSFSDIAKADQTEITLPAQGSKDVNVSVSAPEQAFEGDILGGIRVSALEKTKKSTEGNSVTTNIAYTVGVVLRESDKIIPPKMDLLDVKTEQRNYHNYISAHLQNGAPRIIKKLEATAQVREKDKTQVIYEASKYDMRMAPNSNFYFGINLEDQPFKAGIYIMKVSGKADGQAFSFEKEFEITGKEARTLNSNSVYIEKESPSQWWIYLIIGGVCLLLIVGSVLYFQRKKRTSEEKE